MQTTTDEDAEKQDEHRRRETRRTQTSTDEDRRLTKRNKTSADEDRRLTKRNKTNASEDRRVTRKQRPRPGGTRTSNAMHKGVERRPHSASLLNTPQAPRRRPRRLRGPPAAPGLRNPASAARLPAPLRSVLCFPNKTILCISYKRRARRARVPKAPKTSPRLPKAFPKPHQACPKSAQRAPEASERVFLGVPKGFQGVP